MTVRRAGRDALLVDCAGLEEATALHAEVRRRGLAVRDLVPAAATVLLDGLADPAGTAEQIGAWRLEAVETPPGRLVELPTTYDGPDLGAVADQWGLTEEDVVELHLATEFRVAFCGFAPGFAYCTGLPEDRTVARRSDPRASVPAGSVGLAGPWTAVYPTASPGGWQLIGRTEVRLWDAGSEQPALLPPGTRVRFVRG
ncbi:5-oxoprolinase subunit B family protein [Marmoricola endophyticus]|uniref:5-oxoprolinase subunit B family protein n=1 Tax=Marmoricola endophyticus TaxID=2040280 RepID=UPI00166EF112|nr:allophanate hydrolase subunit 1 [Marmoricola endophyticus]